MQARLLEAVVREAIEVALEEGGNLVEAAKLLGITRHSLKRRIVKHGIRWQSGAGRLPGRIVTARERS